MERDYLVAISIIPRVRGHRETRPILDTGYLPASDAIDKANEVITKKFGSGETLGLFRERRHRHDTHHG